YTPRAFLGALLVSRYQIVPSRARKCTEKSILHRETPTSRGEAVQKHLLRDGARRPPPLTRPEEAPAPFTVGMHELRAGGPRCRAATRNPRALVAVGHHRPRPTPDGGQRQRVARVARADLKRSGCAGDSGRNGASPLFAVRRRLRHARSQDRKA